MDKLISNTDFGFYVRELNVNDHKKLELRENYDLFLKQSLTLGIFVPCDLDGNVIKEYDWVAPDGVKWEDYEKQLLEAKNRVLFKGFEIKDKYNRNEQYINDWIVINGELYFDNQHKAPSKIDLKIEDLVKYNLILTSTAKKQIGL